jgi:hypothetical protein
MEYSSFQNLYQGESKMNSIIKKFITAGFAAGILFTSSSGVFAQDTESTRPLQVSAYGTLLGYGFLYGAGGELLFFRHVGLNVGYTSITLNVTKDTGEKVGKVRFQFVPMHAAYYFGDNHRFYLEGGATYIRLTVSNYTSDNFLLKKVSTSGFLPTGGFGYNYCPNGGGFYFKTGPLFYFIDGAVYPWFGISAGVTF